MIDGMQQIRDGPLLLFALRCFYRFTPCYTKRGHKLNISPS